VLCRRWSGKEGKPAVLQLLVPATLRHDFISRAHTGMCVGHLGVRCTLDQVQRRRFWLGWRRDVRRFCRLWPNCNGYFRGQLPRSGPLQPMLSGAPLERIHIDVTGPIHVAVGDPYSFWRASTRSRNGLKPFRLPMRKRRHWPGLLWSRLFAALARRWRLWLTELRSSTAHMRAHAWNMQAVGRWQVTDHGLQGFDECCSRALPPHSQQHDWTHDRWVSTGLGFLAPVCDGCLP